MSNLRAMNVGAGTRATQKQESEDPRHLRRTEAATRASARLLTRLAQVARGLFDVLQTSVMVTMK